MTLVLKNSNGKNCTMEATKEQITFLKNFGVTVDTSSKQPIAYVENPGYVMGHLKTICS